MSISCLEGVWKVFRSYLEEIWVRSKIFPTPLFGTKIYPICKFCDITNIFFLTMKSSKILVRNNQVFHWESKSMSIYLFCKHPYSFSNPQKRYTVFGVTHPVYLVLKSSQTKKNTIMHVKGGWMGVVFLPVQSSCE